MWKQTSLILIWLWKQLTDIKKAKELNGILTNHRFQADFAKKNKNKKKIARWMHHVVNVNKNTSQV